MKPSRVFSIAALIVAGTGLSGCALRSTAPAELLSVPLAGTVHGGQSPVVGAHIYIFEGADLRDTKSKNIMSSRDLVTNVANPADSFGYYVTSDTEGIFSLTNKYACDMNRQVYVLALGGNPGLSSGATNGALAEMSLLGTCRNSEFSPNLQVAISEASTVASVYAAGVTLTSVSNFTGYFPDPGTFANLVDLNTGYARSTTASGYMGLASSNGVVPQAKINTLADVIAACINSDGSTAPASKGGVRTVPPCGTLFANATSDGTSNGVQPTNTVDALININRHPSANISTLFGLVAANAPFQPTLSTQPADWNLVIQFPLSFTFHGVTSPFTPNLPSIPVQYSSVINIAGVAGGYSGVIALADNGSYYNEQALATTGAYTSYTYRNVSQCIGTQAGRCYFAGTTDEAGAYLGEVQDNGPNDYMNADGTFGAAIAYNGSGLVGPMFAITTDSFNAPYVADSNAKMVSTRRRSTSTIVSGLAPGYAWNGVGADENQNLYLVTKTNNQLFLANSSGTLTNAPGFGGGLNLPNSIVLDSGYVTSGPVGVWVSNGNNTLSRFNVDATTLAATAVSPTGGYTGGGLNFDTAAWPYVQVVSDGNHSGWVPNYKGQRITGMTATGVPITPATGYATGCPSKGIAIDAVGNVWVTCDAPSNSILEFVGLTSPPASN